MPISAPDLRLTERDERLAISLTQKVRLLSLPQAARLCDTTVAYMRRRLSRLQEAGVMTTAVVRSHPVLPLDEPIVTWRPGEASPDAAKVSYRLKARWTAPDRPLRVYFATRKAMQIWGGRAGRIRFPLQATHDVHVTQMYLRVVAEQPELAERWIGEDAVETEDRGKRTDALIVDPGGRTVCAMEFGGAYAYDAIGQRSYMVDPDGGRSTYTFDAAGQIEVLVNPQSQRTTWSYDAAGRARLQRLADGIKVSHTYDAASRLTLLTQRTAADILRSSFEYTYNKAGSRTRLVEAVGTVTTITTWTYDNKQQLTTERRTGDASVFQHVYDFAGNRKTAGTTFQDADFFYYDEANQLYLSHYGQSYQTVTTYTSDGAGNQTGQIDPSGLRTTMTWDDENRMTQWQQGSTTHDFSFNGDGKRMRIVRSNADDSRFVWDGEDVLMETD